MVRLPVVFGAESHGKALPGQKDSASNMGQKVARRGPEDRASASAWSVSSNRRQAGRRKVALEAPSGELARTNGGEAITQG